MGLKTNYADTETSGSKVVKKKMLESGKKPNDFTLTTEGKGATNAQITGKLSGLNRYSLNTTTANSFSAEDLRQTAAFMQELADALEAKAA